MSKKLLFVCAANVCRSPLMAVTFAELAAVGVERSDWTVISRGISVVRRNRMCSLAASDGYSYGSAYAASHISTQVAESELKRQDLIIVASREERARLARMLPASRTRTFTLKEAVSLGRPSLDVNEHARVEGRAVDGDDPLSAYAELLHQRRGRFPVASHAKMRLPWSTPSDPQDIPDVHHGNSKKHASTLKELRELVGTLHGQVEGFFAAAR